MSAIPYIKSLPPVGHAGAQGRQKELLDQALKQIGFIPNMYSNMVIAPALLSTYMHGYGLFRTESGLKPAEQEVVFLAISRANGCDYCTAAHSMIADKMSGVPKDVLAAIREHKAIPDAKLSALYFTTTELVDSHGHLSVEGAQKFLEAGFQERDLLYIVLAIAVKTLSNFTNHAFGTPVDERFAAYKVS